MNEQIIKLLENVNLALEPILQSIANLTGVSVDFVEQNFQTMFYQSGRYMFWDEMLSGLFIYFLIGGFIFGGIIVVIWTCYYETYCEKECALNEEKMKEKAKIKKYSIYGTVASLLSFNIFYIILKLKDIILYNAAKEIWIVEHLAEYIEMIK